MPPPGFRRRERPTEKQRILSLVLVALSGLALVYSMFTPIFYPAGHQWSGGIFLWQYTPHLLVGGGGGFDTTLFVTYFIGTIASAVLGFFCLTGWAGRAVTALLGAALTLTLTVGAFVGLVLLVSLSDDRIAVGPAWLLNTVGAVSLLVDALVPRWRRAWMRPSLV